MNLDKMAIEGIHVLAVVLNDDFGTLEADGQLVIALPAPVSW